MFIGVVVLGPGVVVKRFACWWQKSQMSDREMVEVRHVTKEPEIKDLENIKRITKKWLVGLKKISMDEGMSLMIEGRSRTNVEGSQRVK